VKEQGQGGPEGAPPSQKNAPLKEQGSPKKASETGKDYIAMLSSIRADQEAETFVSDLRQNKEQLLSFAKWVANKPADSREETRDNQAFGIYLYDVALKETYLSTTQREINPADYPDEGSEEPLTKAEWKEILALWATERIASKWLVSHPESEAAKEVMFWKIYGFPDQHHRLLQEMWPAILYDATLSLRRK
jgi:hypothetical protein